MNKQDKELAKQAGFHSVVLLDVYGGEGLCDSELDDLNSLQKFADLIRADEREACAKVCDAEARQFERNSDGAHDERYDWKADGAHDCAEAIRARGNT